MSKRSGLQVQVSHASRVLAELVARAERQEREAPRALDRYVLETGVPELDRTITRWPGVTVFTDGEERLQSTLLGQIALETARLRRPVLWLCARGHAERAALRMATRRARLALRRVFVERNLRAAEWKRLKAAAAELSAWPLCFGDVHGAGAGELLEAVERGIALAEAPFWLVVVDGLDGSVRESLAALERMSDRRCTSVLVAVDARALPQDRPIAVAECGLRPGSRVLTARRSARGRRPSALEHFVLRVGAVGAADETRELHLARDGARERILGPAETRARGGRTT